MTSLRVICGFGPPPQSKILDTPVCTSSLLFFKLLSHLIKKQSFLIVFELRLRSKLLKYLRRKRQRNRLKIIAAQVPTSARYAEKTKNDQPKNVARRGECSHVI